MAFQIAQILLALICATIAFAQTRSQKVCDVSSDLCFEGIHDPSTDTTVGFILPPKTTGSVSESHSFIALISFPLPYGFAGLTLGEANHTADSLSKAMTADPFDLPLFAFPPRENPTALTDFVAPLSTLTSSNTLTPTSTLLTISSKSSLSADRATFIVTCNACLPATNSAPGLFTSDSPLLSLFLQEEKPICPIGVLSDVILPLQGAEFKQFVLNADAARSSQFFSILQTLGENRSPH